MCLILSIIRLQLAALLFSCYMMDFKGKNMTEITLKGSTINTIGTLPAVGTQAPDFTVTKTDLGEIHLKNFIGRPIVLNIFPSLDTSTCAAAMKHFNQMAERLNNVLFLCVSADLPFAQQRFCSAEHLKNVVAASTFRHTSFGRDYGLLITDGPLSGLLSRAVVIIDAKGKIIYTEQVAEIADEPNYKKAEEVLSTL